MNSILVGAGETRQNYPDCVAVRIVWQAMKARNMQIYDTIVIGAGGVGSAVLYHLAARGHAVLGIDRFAPPHDLGSSHGETRVIRQAYFEHPDYVPLLRRTYDLWHELESLSGRQLFTQCGLVEVGPADGEVVPGVLAAATAHRLDVETLSPRDVTRRWPALRIPEGLEAVFEPTAGYLRVEACVEAHLTEATRLGATLESDCEVAGWSVVGDQVEVETSRSKFLSKSLVIAAGAWANRLLPQLGVPLTPLRKSLFWYSAANVKEPEALPVYLYELREGVYYGFPATGGDRIKAAEHTGGQQVTDPLDVVQSIDSGEQQRIESFLAQCVPQVVGPPIAHKTCLYTMAPDHHFVVDRHPDFANVVFAVGLSGHGFKFVPVIGEALADLLSEGATDLPIEFLSAQRFGER
ncbi:MAG: N-methyl-L-tryptophan oxidase [Aeoliella sp.]